MRVSILILYSMFAGAQSFAAAQCLCETGAGCECKKCQCDLLLAVAKDRSLTYAEGCELALRENKPLVTFTGGYNPPHPVAGAIVCWERHSLGGYETNVVVVSEPNGKGWLSWYKTFQYGETITLPTKTVLVGEIRGVIVPPHLQAPTLWLRTPAQCTGPNCPRP